MRIGIFGGAFDPIHYGHLRVAEEVYESLALERVVFLPTAIPPHKTVGGITPFAHRIKMVQVAIEGFDHFMVSDMEKEIPGHSYSIETLRRLHATFDPDTRFYFIVGLDAFVELPTWKEYRRLPSYANFVVVDRPGYSETELKAVLDQHFPGYAYDDNRKEYLLSGQYSVFYRKTTLFGISSTAVRRAVAEGHSVRFLVPSAVEKYIYQERLYAK